MDFLVAGFMVGLLGSFHCVGMCGPIALALPVHKGSQFEKIAGISLYNFGRIFTYAVIGILFGLLGEGFAMAGFQQGLSISLGVLILLLLIFPNVVSSSNRVVAPLYKVVNFAKNKMRLLFNNQSYASLLTIGMLNGLLPCGLIYIAVIGAMATASIWKGTLFMTFFGIGTIPIMAGVAFLGNFVSMRVRNQMRSVVPVVVGVMAILLILRGLNLGIPYVSPKMSQDGKTMHKCCHR